jgi:nitroreductase
MEAIEALTTRVSGSKLIEPAPDELELHSLLAAAARAPDHGRLRPWRFIVVRGDARRRLGALMADTYFRRYPDATPEQLDKERGKPLRAPLIVIVAAKVNEQSHIPAIEQILAAGAAAENIMVGAFALGYGCAWKTGDAAYDTDVKAAFDLGSGDAIVGFMYLGTNATPPPPAPPIDINEFARDWRP